MRYWFPTALLLAFGGCAAKKSTPLEEIPKLTKLADVMDNQSTVADPLFKKMDQTSFTDDEFKSMEDASARLKITAPKIKDFSKGPDFDALATRLGEKANALGDAARAKNAAGASTALKEMKATCKECHSKFK
jgi:cytochrome c556